MENVVKGFKVFNPDWSCRGFKYEVGKVFEEDVNPKVCEKGFHFCKQAKDCFRYYAFDPENKVAEVIALSEVDEEGNLCCTNKIKIVREISWEELLTIVNTGKGNSGLCNTGNYNSGDYNTGNYNSAHYNSGDSNSGYMNSGDSNSGDYNTGDCNSGHRNSGDYNTGHRNSGNCNTGDYNTGDWNKGNFCTGDFNIVDYQTGCFCTEENHKIMFFDKESNMTFEEWRKSEAYSILCRIIFEPTRWIWEEEMSDEEKVEHPEYETTGGYLKVCNTDKVFLTWWDSLDERERNIIKSIPNFDAEKFFQITGIRV